MKNNFTNETIKQEVRKIYNLTHVLKGYCNIFKDEQYEEFEEIYELIIYIHKNVDSLLCYCESHVEHQIDTKKSL